MQFGFDVDLRRLWIADSKIHHSERNKILPQVKIYLIIPVEKCAQDAKVNLVNKYNITTS
jgi:hypothetical protein